MSYRGSIGVGIAMLSTALLSCELLLTRIFSVVIWYHFAFFAISVALFGTGAAAIVVHLGQRRVAEARTSLALTISCIALGWVIFGLDHFLIHFPPDWFGTSAPTFFPTLTGRLLLVFAATAAPFFVGGLAISLAMTRYARHIHRLYFWDLLGAGLGCVIVIPLLSWLGGPLALVVSAVLALLSALPFATTTERPRRLSAIALVSVGLFGLGAATSPTTGALEIRVAKGVRLSDVRPELNLWNSFSMVTVLPATGFVGWGLSPNYRGPIPPQKTLVIDMNALTTLTRFDGDLESIRYATFDLSAMVYRIRPAPRRVCVVGAGGGKDVLAALAAGAEKVTAVEINPLIVEDVVRGKYREFTGDLYGRPDVEAVVDDGRGFLRRTSERFDVVLLSMVDTSAATAAGAYTLTENSLYTSDALSDFLDRLTPDGILEVSTASLPELSVGARLVAVARQAVLAHGGDPSRAVAVLRSPWLGTSEAILNAVLVKPSGLSDAEVATLDKAARQLGFSVAYLPGRPLASPSPEVGWMHQILGERDDAALGARMRSWPMDVSAVDDDRPFFFYQNWLADFPRALITTKRQHLFGNGLVILAKVVVIAAAMVLAFLLLPLVFARRRLRQSGTGLAADLSFVACLGAGFMFLEIGLLQRFSLYLGQPTHTLAVVLFVLLVAGGVGSRSYPRWAARRGAASLSWLLFAVAAGSAAMALLTPSLLSHTVVWGSGPRAALTALLIAPLGWLMGAPLPTALRSVADRSAERIPWLWSINSATSVLGGILATLTSLHAGITVTFLVGGGFYLGALALWGRVAPARPAADIEPDGAISSS